MRAILTDGKKIFDNRSNLSLFEVDTFNKQEQGNLHWEIISRHFFCPNTCLAGSQDGCTLENELPEDAELTDDPAYPICPCYTLTARGTNEY